MTSTPIQIGSRVEAGEGHDHDIGYVVEPLDHEMRIPHRDTDMMVAWDSGVRTWTAAADLSVA